MLTSFHIDERQELYPRAKALLWHSVDEFCRLTRRQAVSTSMRRVPDLRMAEPLMLELLHRGASPQAAMTIVVCP